ncbi:hypothetical protein D6D01_04012 [Aureobasidium pullulans]|uniref:Uncharacterized protein n=1 Tax=Aureobasidium pullulans TaxID=5580 RepID=A0A4S9LF02_AURPU|nr:hypothetical protein D6D01_04012 [Aureobasidium pullulans]
MLQAVDFYLSIYTPQTDNMAANTPPVVFVSSKAKYLIHMLDKNDLMSFAHAIEEYEGKYSPSNSKRVSIPHLGSLDVEPSPQGDLLSILNNSLIADLKDRKFKLHTWNHVETHDFLIADKASPRKIGIYINYLATRDGGGLTIPEYERYFEAMLSVIDNRRIPSDPTRDLVDECDQFYMRHTGSRVSDVPKMQDSCYKHRGDFNLKQRQLIAEAKAQGATEIRLPGEAGYSDECDERIREHDRLRGSANFFRLARCVLGCLWPGRFSLYSIILFRVNQFKDADVGESMASHIGATYAAYGGFNFVQAGVQILTAHRLNQDDFRQAARNLPGMIKFMKRNLKEELEYWRNINNMRRDRLNVINHFIGCRDLDEAFKKKLEVVKRLDFKKDLERCQRRIKRIAKFAEAKDTEAEMALMKIKGLAKSLGILKPVYQETQAGESVWNMSQFTSQG